MHRMSRMICAILAAITLCGCVNMGPTVLRLHGLADFDVTMFGAVADGKTVNTEFIQAAIDTCSGSGGGRVTIPAGKFVTGTIVMRDGVELYLEKGAHLVGSVNADDYRQAAMKQSREGRGKRTYSLIYAEGAQDIAVCGAGTIDGRGHKLQEAKGGRPKVLFFISCKDVRVEGLKLMNSAVWMQHYRDCERVRLRGLTVWNHGNRNNDALDIDGCRDVIVSDCSFDSDDDAVTLKSTGAAACEDVVISNCTISSHCNAIKAGTESMGGFRRVAISNCVISPSKEPKVVYGMAGGISGVSLEIVDGGTMEGVTVSNIVMRGGEVPIFVRLGNRARRHSAGAAKPGVGVVRNVTLSAITAYDTGVMTSSITGIPGHPVENIIVRSVQIFGKGGIEAGDYEGTVPEQETAYPEATMWGRNLPACGLFIRHAKNVSVSGLMLGAKGRDVRAPIWAEDVDGLRVEDVMISGEIMEGPFVRGKGLRDYSVEKPTGWRGPAVELAEAGPGEGL